MKPLAFYSRFAVLSMILSTVLTSIIYSQEPGESISGELIKKANHCFEMRQYDSAVLLYKKFLSGNGLPLNREDTNKGNQQDKNLEALISMQIANIYTLKEEYPSAESWYNIALNLADSWSRLKAEIYQNLGSLFFFKEHYEYAILYYQKSWIIYSKEPERNSGRIFDLLTSLGTAYSGNVEYQKSLSCFCKADSVLKISKKYDLLKCAALNINIGEVLLKLDAPEKALYRYRSAYKLASGSSISSTNIRITSNEGMAECYTCLGQVDSAMKCLENCLKLITLTGTNMKNDSSRIYLFMGDVRARHGEWEKSMKYYNQALAILLSDSKDFSVEEANLSRHETDLLDLYKIYGHMGKSQLQSAIQAYSDTVTLSRSFSDFLKALKICDHISKDFGRGTSRMTFHESIKSILSGAIESGFRLKEKKGTMDFDELFSMADANKNRVLLEDMEENRSMTLSGVPDSILKKIRALKDEIVFYSRKYIKEDSSPGTSPYSGLDELQNKVIDLKLKLDQLRKKINQYSPDYPLQTQLERKVYPSSIMKSLRNDEAMIEYLCSDSVIYLLLIRHEGLSVKRVVLPSSFNYSLKECLHQLKGAGVRNFTLLSRTLYNYLIAPVEPLLKNIRHLIIIPDEELSLFPFETLIREDPLEASGKDATSWHYLLRDFEIIYHFSAESWFKDTANAGLLKTAYRFAGFAPGFRNNADKPVSLNPLPFTLKEVTAIAALFGQVPRHQPVFLDTSATEKNFRLYAPGNTHIHIATHSLISGGDPMNSALIFSKSIYIGGQQDKNDGLLYLDEISNLQLDASLVVLSACATGKGKVTRTEGVLALTRGFYLAGASNVVYSLWSIPDHLTGEFMLNFYQCYFSGKSYSTSLREVKLKMISRPETSLPYMWAGIVLLGRR